MQQQLASALNGWMNERTNERIHLANWLFPSYCFTPTWHLVLDPIKRFSSPGEISPKNRKLKTENIEKKVILDVFSRQKWEFCFLKAKFARFIYLVFTVLAKDIGGLIKIFILFWIYNQIWLNLPRDDLHIFLFLCMDDHHFGYKQKFLKKNNWNFDGIKVLQYLM
jgi:hypothetical protein